VVFLPLLCINGVTNHLTHLLGLAWPCGIIIQCTNFLSRGFDLIVESNDINFGLSHHNELRLLELQFVFLFVQPHRYVYYSHGQIKQDVGGVLYECLLRIVTNI